jgi:hypothetical protein
MRLLLSALALVLTSVPVNGFAGEAEDDFAARCNAADVVKCVGFDDPADIAGDSQDNSGILSGASTPALDARQKASGASSILFTIPSNSPADTSGSYFTNFSEDLSIQFGEGEQFFVQWRQLLSPDYLDTPYAGGGGWKQVIIGTGDQPGQPYYSCTDLEVVTVNGYYRGFPQMYNSCSGSASHGPYDGFEEPFGGSDFKLQNARPDPFCLYSQGQTNYFPPTGNCFAYVADEWMTFQVGIELGARVGDEFVDSSVKLWVARQGSAAELVVDWGPYNLTAGDPALNERFGKVWLLPYNTGKDPSEAHATAYTWYDELIVSRSRIADPGAPPSTSSASASGSTAGAGGATTTAQGSGGASAAEEEGGCGIGGGRARIELFVLLALFMAPRRRT